jgi:tetratricopeptide (TPR) repeat protein
VDTGSTDDTVAIARKHGCRIESVEDRFDTILDAERAAEIERRFAIASEGPLVTAGQRLFHFGKARQQAGLLAANPFVLQLDAGDEVPAMDIDALDRWIGAGSVGAFEYDQQYGSVGLRIARFYDRGRYRWEGRVHEILVASAPADAAPLEMIRCDTTQLRVRHHKDENKPRHYLAGLALQALECPQKPRWWHYLGRELFYDHRYESAIAVLETHAAMEDAWSAERSQSLCFVGECLEALDRPSEAREAYLHACTLDPTRREPLLRLASNCCRRGELEAAADFATQALGIPRTCAYPELEANYTWMPHSLLYWSLFWLGRKDEARVHWEAYRSLAPEGDMTRDHARLFPPVTESGRS